MTVGHRLTTSILAVSVERPMVDEFQPPGGLSVHYMYLIVYIRFLGEKKYHTYDV